GTYAKDLRMYHVLDPADSGIARGLLSIPGSASHRATVGAGAETQRCAIRRGARSRSHGGAGVPITLPFRATVPEPLWADATWLPHPTANRASQGAAARNGPEHHACGARCRIRNLGCRLTIIFASLGCSVERLV